MDGWKINFLLGLPIFRCHVSFRECIFFFQVMITVLNLVIWIKLREFVDKQSTTCSDFTPFKIGKSEMIKGKGRLLPPENPKHYGVTSRSWFSDPEGGKSWRWKSGSER